jgi:hypothetical protein
MTSATVIVDLGHLFDNVGTSHRANLSEGAFNVWRNSFPAEELPAGSSLVEVAGVPYRFPPTSPGVANNVVCAGQRIDLPADRYDWLYLLVCAERRAEDVVHLHYVSGAVDDEWLRVSDFWPGSPPHFGEVEAFRCEHLHFPRHVQPRVQPVIWQQRVPVPRQEPLARVRLPDNMAIHIFALTAVRSEPAAVASRPAGVTVTVTRARA